MNIYCAEAIYFALGVIIGVLIHIVGTAIREGCVNKEDK